MIKFKIIQGSILSEPGKLAIDGHRVKVNHRDQNPSSPCSTGSKLNIETEAKVPISNPK
jgi:hypothetical protein